MSNSNVTATSTVNRQLIHRCTLAVIHDGEYETTKDCALGAIRRGIDLSEVDLRNVHLAGVNFRGAKLSLADLALADLTGANLRGSDLTGANLTGSDLTGANLRGSDLTGANLTGSDLTGANLRGSDLTGANLRGAILARAIFHGATINWNSHALIVEILFRESGKDIEKRKVSGLIAVSTDWCWEQFIETGDPLLQWGLDILAGYVTEDDGAPQVIAERAGSTRAA